MSAEERTWRIDSLLSSIRYGIFLPAVTTMGNCPNCRASSRGAGLCTTCLVDFLGGMIDDRGMAQAYATACAVERSAKIDRERVERTIFPEQV